MMLLTDRQADMRLLATALASGEMPRKEALAGIKRLRKMEVQSAEGSQATIDRSEHSHVKKSGQAALQNRKQTILYLDVARDSIRADSLEEASEALIAAANCGGKKSVKAARKAPTVALYVQYLAETDAGFQEWLTTQGVTV